MSQEKILRERIKEGEVPVAMRLPMPIMARLGAAVGGEGPAGVSARALIAISTRPGGTTM